MSDSIRRITSISSSPSTSAMRRSAGTSNDNVLASGPRTSQRREDVIDDREGEIQIAHGTLHTPHAVESLAARAVVKKMTVDVDQRSPIREIADRVAIPDLLHECFRFGDFHHG
jgi:hypothetical protein